MLVGMGITFWASMWMALGWVVLLVALQTRRTRDPEQGMYGIGVWIGFWSAWPYVLYAKSAWLEPISPDAEQIVKAAIRKAQS